MSGNNEFKYSAGDAIKWANYIISYRTSLKKASLHFHVPPATIWRYLKSHLPSSLQEDVEATLNENKKNSPHKAIKKKWENYYSQSK